MAGLGLRAIQPASGASILSFSDTFEAANSNDINHENNAGRQTGAVGVLAYLENVSGANDPLSRLTGGNLRLEATAGNVYTAVTPNHNFIEGGNFTIEFDLDAGSDDAGSASGDWACLVFGSSTPGPVFVNGSDGMGILFRNNGAIQVFDGGASVYDGGALPLGRMHVRIDVESGGFGLGAPATLRMFVDGNPVQIGASTMEHVKAAGLPANYITLAGAAFGGANWMHEFDNLSITATPCIHPAVSFLRSHPGQTNQLVTVSIPPSLNATGTVAVVVTSSDPGVAEPLGAVARSLTLSFPPGTTARDYAVAAWQKGSATLSLSTPSGGCIEGATRVAVGGTSVGNPSFEENALGGVGYGPLARWTGPSGVNAAGQPFADNGVFPDRGQVAFVQGSGTLRQFLAGLDPARSHWLQFRYNVRNCCGGTMNLAVGFGGVTLDTINNIQAVGGTNAYHVRSISFIPARDSGDLEFVASVAGDASLLLDGVTVVPRGPGQVLMYNPGFEASGVVPFPGYIGPALISGWSGVGSYGVNVSGAGPFADNGVNPDQDSVAFIQGIGSLAQVISNLVVGQTYKISYSVNARDGNEPLLRVSMGGAELYFDLLTAVGGSTPYRRLTNEWIATAAAAELRFEQVQGTEDNTLLLDDVQMEGLVLPPCQTTVSVDRFELFRGQPLGPSQVTIGLPLYLVATSAVDVVIISLNPAVAIPTGAAGDRIILHFAQGNTNLSFGITVVGAGTAVFVVSNTLDCASTSFVVRNRSSFVLNPSFEDNGSDVWPGYGFVTDWMRIGGGGLNPITVDHPSGRSPFADNGVTPDRNQVTFLQGPSSLSQVLYGLETNKPYWLQVRVNARNCCAALPAAAARFNGVDLASAPVVPPVGGGNPYYFFSLPFTPNSPTGALELVSLPLDPEGDRTLLLDAVSVVQRDASEVVIENPSFEASGIPPAPGYIQPASIAGWSAVGGYGVNLSGAGPFADNGVNTDQDNVAFLQGQGSMISQTINNLTPGNTYVLSYAYNARGGNLPQLTVTADGNTVHDEVFPPVGGHSPYRLTNILFTAGSTSVTLAFAQTAAGDNTVLLDNVRIVPGVALESRLRIAYVPGEHPSVRVSWPQSLGPAWTLQSSSALPGGFMDAGLPVNPEVDEFAVYDEVMSGGRFYRLAR